MWNALVFFVYKLVFYKPLLMGVESFPIRTKDTRPPHEYH